MTFYADIASAILRLVLALVSTAVGVLVIPWLKSTAIPWLKEKRLYGIVKQYVRAAEKLAETGAIDRGMKKDYVVGLLGDKGFIVDDEVDAFIESAVKELDIAVDVMLGEIVNEFEMDDGDPMYDVDEEVEG